MTKVATKKSESKKAEVKKAPAKKVAKAIKQDKKGPGRPPGPLHVPEWIEVSHHTLFARKNGKVHEPGFGSMKLRAGKDGAPNLEKLADLIRTKDQRLVKLLK